MNTENLKKEIIELEKKIIEQRSHSKDIRYWKKIQQNSQRGFNVIFPPLSCIVQKMCCKLLSLKHILWIGGAPGAGKTTCTKRFQEYGFMTLDSEDPTFYNMSSRGIKGLQQVTEKVNKELDCSFVIGAGCGNFLLDAPDYVIPILILPEQSVYTKRWKSRNNVPQNHQKWYEEDVEIAKTNKDILVLHQPIDECVETTIYRICELVLNKK